MDHRTTWGTETLRCDNGPEFPHGHFLAWCEPRKIRLVHIQPGRPVQNGCVESFNGRLLNECLNANWFPSIGEAKQRIENWRENTIENGHIAAWDINVSGVCGSFTPLLS
jgi:transposase InsO family protein